MALRNLLKRSSASVKELREDAEVLTQMAAHYQNAANEIESAQNKASKLGNDPSK